jgi:hypothetical protein
MKRKQFFEEQIICILKEAEAGAVVTSSGRYGTVALPTPSLPDGSRRLSAKSRAILLA